MSDHYIRVDNPDKGCTYSFFTGWSFIENIESKGHNFDKIYMDVINRVASATLLKDVLVCSLNKVDSDEISMGQADAYVIEFFDHFGYQEMSHLAYIVVLDAVRSGDEKKRLESQREIMSALSQRVKYSPLKSFLSHGWQWITLLVIFTSAASATLNFLVMHFLPSMV